MKTRILSTIVIAGIILGFAAVASAQIAGTGKSKIGAQTLVDPARANKINVSPPPPPTIPDLDHRIEFIATNEDNREDIVLVVDINGTMTYSHQQGSPFNQDRIDIEVRDVLDAATVTTLFGMLAAGGFMELPDEFPQGGAYKSNFDTAMTLVTPSETKSVFASDDALVSQQFETIRTVMHAFIQAIENRTLVDFEIYSEDGVFLAGVEVQADGDARVRVNSENPDAPGLRVLERSLTAQRVESLEGALGGADFFALPACSDSGRDGAIHSPYEFVLTYNANSQSHTVRFGTGSDAANDLSFFVDWALGFVD